MKLKMEVKLLTKHYNGIYLNWGKFWKGIYFHFPTFTIRLFLWGADYRVTTKFKKWLEIDRKIQ